MTRPALAAMTVIGSGRIGSLARGAVWALIFAVGATRWAIKGGVLMAAVFAAAAVATIVVPLALARRAHRAPLPAPARVAGLVMDIGGLVVAGLLLVRVLRL